MAALLALYARALRELLRAPLAHWACTALVGVIFLFLLGAHASATATTAPGLKFFLHVLTVVLIAMTLAGVTYFATAITEEKEEGTLALLRMTDLSPLAILLGKSTSRLSAALLVLAATLPFTLLAVTLGGISARQVFASYLCLGAYLILLANLALLVSVLSPRGAVATVAASVVVVGAPALGEALRLAPAWLAGLPVPAVAETAAFLGPPLAAAGEALGTVNPFRRLATVLASGWSGPVVGGHFWISLALAGGCLTLAWACFDAATGEARRLALPRAVPRSAGRGAAWAPGRAWLVSAPAWKDFHFLHGGRPVLWIKWIGYGLLTAWVAWPSLRRGAPLAETGLAIGWWMTLALAVELGLIGSRLLRTELREKTLPSLASLPLSMKHIVLMKLDGARRTLAPVFAWLCLGFGLMLGSALTAALQQSDLGSFNVFGHLILFGYVASQLWLLAHLAAHFSLRFSWGALPLGLAVVLLANIVGLAFCIGAFVLPVVALTYVTQLRAGIYQRLEQLAAED
jgi:ABC-type transport system involved in multi-copper enzyme maturation permease subunit